MTSASLFTRQSHLYRRLAWFSVMVAFGLLSPLAHAQTEAELATVPKNLGLGLRSLVAQQQTLRKQQIARKRAGNPLTAVQVEKKLDRVLNKYSHVQTDASNRVLVEVYLNGIVAPTDARAQREALGMTVTGELDWYRHGTFSAWLPLNHGVALATMPGIKSARISPTPHCNVGQITSQGVDVLNVTALNTNNKAKGLSTYDGSGVTVGVLSDSFNTLVNLDATVLPQDPQGRIDDATTDALNDDLPGVGNLTRPTVTMTTVMDYPAGTDEGRAMCQIIHDMAPNANLAFATAELGESNFASNIANLASIGCQVICDDVSYAAEPMFSDGPIAQAIDTAATNNNVFYSSSAGNDGNSGYAADFSYVSDTTARALGTAHNPALTVDTTNIPTDLTVGGWHNFNPDKTGTPVIAQKVTTGSLAVSLVLQWDDPFDAGAITTDYNILVFDSTGAYQSSLSGTDTNYSDGSLTSSGTDEPIEEPSTTLSASTTYYIAITRAMPGDASASTAKHMRYVAESDGGGFSGDYINNNNIETYGHNCAANCAGTAAYVYDQTPSTAHLAAKTFFPQIETFSSNGPVNIYFDKAGNRLTTPNARRQPFFSAVDGVDTSFFPPSGLGAFITPTGILVPPTLPITLPIITPVTVNPNDYDGNGFPNFFGTSAAAPHAAAVAALIINAANTNNIGTLAPRYIRNLMANTTQGEIDTTPGYIEGSGTAAGNIQVAISATGEDSTSPNTFSLTFTAPSTGPAYQLTSLVIDLTNSGLVFDESTTTGYPFTQGDTSNSGGATLITTPQPVLSTNREIATLLFSGFNSGDIVNFGVDRDVIGINAYGNGSDLLQGSTFNATLTNPATLATVTVKGAFTNLFNRSYNYKAGYGLIDAQAAVNTLLGQ